MVVLVMSLRSFICFSVQRGFVADQYSSGAQNVCAGPLAVAPVDRAVKLSIVTKPGWYFDKTRPIGFKYVQ